MSIEEMVKKIDSVLDQMPPQRNSLFQMKYFIIGSQPTWNGKLWQCLLELRRIKESVDAFNNEKEEMMDQLELVKIEIEETLACNTSSSFEERKKEIRLKQLKRKKVNIEKSINSISQKLAYVLEESSFYVETFKNINEKFPVADFDNEDAQTEYWNAKFKEELDLRMLLQQPLDLELIKSVLSLPDEAQSKKQMLGTLAGIQKQLIEQKKLQESNRMQTNIPKNNTIRLTE